jgi:hypothetical protein
MGETCSKHGIYVKSIENISRKIVREEILREI